MKEIKTLFSQKQIEKRLDELAKQIEKDYGDKPTLHRICRRRLNV